jgi:hypothetical protein
MISFGYGLMVALSVNFSTLIAALKLVTAAVVLARGDWHGKRFCPWSGKGGYRYHHGGHGAVVGYAISDAFAYPWVRRR